MSKIRTVWIDLIDFKAAAAIAAEEDRPLRRPGRGRIDTGIERQSNDIAAIVVHHINLGVAVAGTSKRDFASVRRPCRQPIAEWVIGHVDDIRAIGVHHVNVIVACVKSDECDSSAIVVFVGVPAIDFRCGWLI